MSFDCSRFTFDPLENFQGVVLQQGRPQLDSDWNEWAAEEARRDRAGALDILGPEAVPDATTPGGFNIGPAGDDQGHVTNLSIGAGRMYVDGILAENHGLSPLSPHWVPPPAGGTDPSAPAGAVWDPRLEELTGGDLDYTGQPHLPSPPDLPSTLPFTVYLDVWQREVTDLIDPELTDKAVGVDTAGRLQTVWQVKAAPGDTACAAGLGDLLAGQGVFPSASRLTTDTAPVPPGDICHLPPGGGYTGLENQLYRVEIHRGSDGQGTAACFKWSRVNATVATAVLRIDVPGNSLVVQSLGKDDVLGFSAGDWIEITDDNRELNGLPGDMARVARTDPATFTVYLAPPAQPLSGYPVDGQGNTDPSRHTRIRRWDQRGKVLLADGQTVYWDLDNPADGSIPAGTIPVPAAQDGQSAPFLLLEKGVTVAFDLDAGVPQGQYASGDHWAFAARTLDGTVERLEQAPPRGIHHHYAGLAVVYSPECFTDIRAHWAPASGGCCRVSLDPGQLQGGMTLQSVADRYRNRGGAPTVICLSAGTYRLEAPLRLTAEHRSLTLEGCPGTVFEALPDAVNGFTDGMVVVTGFTFPPGRPSLDITLRGIEFHTPGTRFNPPQAAEGDYRFAGLPEAQLPPDLARFARAPGEQSATVSIGVRAVNAVGLTIEGCLFIPQPTRGAITSVDFWAGVFATGQCDGVRLIGNEFQMAGPSKFMAGYLQVPTVAFNPPPPVAVGILGSNLSFTGSNTGFIGSTAAVTGSTPAYFGSNASALGSSLYCLGSNLAYLGSNLAYLGSNLSFFSAYSNAAAQPNFSIFGGYVLASTLDHSLFVDNRFSCNVTMGPDSAVALLVLGETGEVRLVGNEVQGLPPAGMEGGIKAGFWVLSTLQALYLQYDFTLLGGSLFAMGYPLPPGMAGGPVPPAQVPLRAFAGDAGAEPIDASDGTWVPDGDQPDGLEVGGGHIISTNDTIYGAGDPQLYKAAREGNAGEDIVYTFTRPDGSVPFYQVVLKFAEIGGATFDADAKTDPKTGVTTEATYKRQFNILVNDVVVESGFDIYVRSKSGTTSIETIDLYFDNILPVDGKITVRLQADKTNSPHYGPLVSAVLIQPALLAIPTSFGGTQNFFLDLLGLSQQVFPDMWPAPAPLNLRVAKNSVSSRALPALLATGAAQDPQVSLLTVNSNLLVQNEVEPVSGEVTENFNPNLLVSTLGMAGLTSVVVNGNQVFNNSPDGQFALFLDTYDVLSPVFAAVTGNVFRGIATKTTSISANPAVDLNAFID